MTAQEVHDALAALVDRDGSADAEAARSDAMARHLTDPWQHVGGLRKYFRLRLLHHKSERLTQPGSANYPLELIWPKKARPPRKVF